MVKRSGGTISASSKEMSSGPQCSEGDVRLVDGRSDTEGQVEICVDGLWGSVCADKWDYRDAQVVCRQLKFNGREYLCRFNCFLWECVFFQHHIQYKGLTILLFMS